MIGLVIVTHGRLAEEFIFAMEHVVGPQEQVVPICIGPEDDMEKRRKDILAACGRVDTGEGVILLTDMFGGTPSNLAISQMVRKGVEVLSGVNLPMLVKLAKVRGQQDEDSERLLGSLAEARDEGRDFSVTLINGRNIVIKPFQVCRGYTRLAPPSTPELQDYHWLMSYHPLELVRADGSRGWMQARGEPVHAADGTITFANDLFLAAMKHRQRADAGDCCSVGRLRPGAGGRSVARHRRRQPGTGIILANLMRRPP